MVNGSTIVSGFKQKEICSGQLNIPASFETPTTADLIIFLKVEETSKDFIALASPCRLGTDKRPNVGIVILNQSKIIIARN